jgi:hypothetical protein
LPLPVNIDTTYPDLTDPSVKLHQQHHDIIHRDVNGLNAIRYAHSTGNDANDGQSWGTAKKTVLAAYDSLPSVGGTIKIGANTQVGGEIAGQGIWLAGNGDPQHAAMTAPGVVPGWRKIKSVKFEGVPGEYFEGGKRRNSWLVPGTGQANWSGPWIWLSYCQIGIEFHRLSSRGGGTPYGIDMTRFSTGAQHSDAYNCAGVYFWGIDSRCSNLNANNGYNPIRSKGSFWIDLDACNFDLEVEVNNTLVGTMSAAIPGSSQVITVGTAAPTAWPTVTPFTVLMGHERLSVTSIAGTSWTVTRGFDNTGAIAHANGENFVVDPKTPIRSAMYLMETNGPNYLWNVKNIVPLAGSIRAEGTSVSRWENIALESCSGSAIYFVNPSLGNVVDMVDIYDQPNAFAMGLVDVSPLNTSPSCVSIAGSGFGVGRIYNVHGPAVMINGSKGSNGINFEPSRYTGWFAQGQMGFMERKLYGQHDTARRAGVSVARQPNRCSQTPSAWTGPGGVTPGQTDVFGLSNAGSYGVGMGAGAGISLHTDAAWNPSAPAAGEWEYSGDFVFFGAWIRPDKQGWNTEFAFANTSPLQLNITAGPARFKEGPFSPANGTIAHIDPVHQGNQEWDWYQGYAKVGVGGLSTLNLRAYGNARLAYPVLFYASGISDTEATEMFHHLQAYPTGAPAGSISTFPNQKLIAKGGLGVGNAVDTSPLGALVKRVEVFDETGASIGFIPVYEYTPAPDEIAGLAGWFDFSDISTLFQDTARTTPVTADGQMIKGITDLSGSANHLTEATNGPAYTVGMQNGLSGGRWDGVNDILRKDPLASAAPTTGWTLLIVSRKRSALDATSRTLVNLGGFVQVRCQSSVHATGMNYYINNTGGTTLNVLTSPTTWGVDVLRNVGGGTQAYTDGGTSVPCNADPGVAITGLTRIILGEFNDLDVAEVLFYRVGVSDTELNILGNYLADKWALSWTNI